METVEIEVAYPISATEAKLITLSLPKGSSVWEALLAFEAVKAELPSQGVSFEADKSVWVGRVGIFGTMVALEKTLESGDRVELYQPLLIDPKEARRKRAAKTAKPLKPKGPWKNLRASRS